MAESECGAGFVSVCAGSGGDFFSAAASVALGFMGQEGHAGASQISLYISSGGSFVRLFPAHGRGTSRG